jgi:2-dehydro-3-deoxyphosphogluconate aldolase/(4S)-4-hydroxy-2-oxoglutarate aldolase
MTVPGAIGAIRKLAQSCPEMIVGAGTVLDKETAQRCLDAGARFLTSTGFVAEVIESALSMNVVAIPGALTPTEVIAAWKSGADFVKIYPVAPIGGDLYIRSLKVPLPQVKLIAAGGVNQQNATRFIAAGASALGVGVELLPRDAVQRRQDHRIDELARRFLGFVRDGQEPAQDRQNP